LQDAVAPHRPYKKPGLGWPGYQAGGALRSGRPGGEHWQEVKDEPQTIRTRQPPGIAPFLESSVAMCVRESSSEARDVVFTKVVP
jgi:hypothetical protein